MMKPIENALHTLYRYDKQDIIRAFLSAAVHYPASVCVWRLPEQQQTVILASCRHHLTTLDDALHINSRGFIISPFDVIEGRGILYIPADVCVVIQEQQVVDLFIGDASSGLPLLTMVIDILHQSVTPPMPYHILSSPVLYNNEEKSHFIEIVEQGILAIKQAKLKKIVPARRKIIDIIHPISPETIFYQLCKRYASAFVSFISIPEFGTWIGASPELIIHVNRDQMFKTVAIAGTQSYNKGMDVSQATWTEKEIEEQALVSRFIIDQFKTIRVREFEESGPRTMIAGNILHLKTEFTVDLKAVQYPDLAIVMLKLLHPTSAVCGMPKKESRLFLQHHEAFPRKLYGGYLGPVNIDHETHVYVNIRCMELLNRSAVLYAGAGVTLNSDPQKEWLETELKCQTLESVINYRFSDK
ncbi:MAG: chorismate-binding protein [Desulfobacterales bacterium]|nr:chorismate-binding protein [Desulfobacterales bacterium]